MSHLFKMNPNLILTTAPPLDPAWLAHEKSANLLAPAPVLTSSTERQQLYAASCRKINAELLSGRDKHLTEGTEITDSKIERTPGEVGGSGIGVRCYSPPSSPSGTGVESGSENERGEADYEVPTVIYFHGGGIYVGDLDSEDLTCRRICKTLTCTVYSIDYRLMPEYTASEALDDAIFAFKTIAMRRKGCRLIVMGSSSGGQLAAQVSQWFCLGGGAKEESVRKGMERIKIHGVLLRGPVTCDATSSGSNLLPQFKGFHTSMSPSFHTSLLSNAAVNSGNRTNEPLPLEVADLKGVPRHWIQVSTNDLYYSDGVCYAEALRGCGVELGLDVVVGWPHTFWLKAPELERAVEAEGEMIRGLKWLLE